MDRLLYTAMTGATGTLNRQASVAHNLANVSTHGYRSEEHRLRAVQVQTHNRFPAALPTRAFAVDASTHTDFRPGALMHTGNRFDLAVRGQGWIAMAMPDGTEAYTRNGGFTLNENGVLQNANGIPVQGEGGPITIPPGARVSIGGDGTISVLSEAEAGNVVNVVGRVKLTNPPPGDLVRGGDGFFRLAAGGEAEIDNNVRVVSGYLENSNVDPVEQMVAMISLARQFEMQMRMITTAETNDRAATQILSPR